MSRFFAQCTAAQKYSISNRVPATSQNLRAVCRLTFLLLSIDRIVEPSRKEEASSTELLEMFNYFFKDLFILEREHMSREEAGGGRERDRERERES